MFLFIFFDWFFDSGDTVIWGTSTGDNIVWGT